LRVITIPDKNAQTATVLVLVGAGSKYETKENNGISHFLEHMFFKGTKKRPTTMEIAETLDRVGGAYNAFTSKEYTGYWAKVDADHLGLATDWVSDILLNSKIESKEIKREKGVIVGELNMYLDTPTRYIEDLWEELLYGDQPAGWQTIGTKENILGFERKDFLSYLKTHYSTLNSLVCLAGNIGSLPSVRAKVQNYFSGLNPKPIRPKIGVTEKQEKPNTLVYPKKTDQTHIALGVRGYDIFSPRKYAQEVLAVILGGNMSSRLFISVRERAGLGYYVRTSAETYTDSGYLVTQAGVSHQDAKKAIGLILKEYRDIKDKKVPAKELQKAKDYLKGSMLLGLESSEAKASFYGIQELLTGRILDLKDKFRLIDRVSREDVREAAQEIFRPEKLNLAIIGPHKDKNLFEELLKI